MGPRDSCCTNGAFKRFRTRLASVASHLNRAVPSFRGVRLHHSRLHRTIGRSHTKHTRNMGSFVTSVRDCVSRVYLYRHLFHRNGLRGRIYRYSAGIGGVVFSRRNHMLYIVSLSAIVPSLFIDSCNSFLHATTGAVTRSSPRFRGVSFHVSVFRSFAHKCIRSTSTFLSPLRVSLLPRTTRLFPCVRTIHFL